LFWYILLLFSFKFENQTLVQTPSTVNATEFQKCFYLCNGSKNQSKLPLLLKIKSDSVSERVQNPAKIDSGSMATSGTYFQVFVICSATHPKTN